MLMHRAGAEAKARRRLTAQAPPLPRVPVPAPAPQAAAPRSRRPRHSGLAGGCAGNRLAASASGKRAHASLGAPLCT